jgi:arylsulfatase
LASDNGGSGAGFSGFGNQGTPDMGNNGPFRGALGESSEGSIRTAAIIRWPGHVKPDTTSYAMFSIMDFLPTLASIVGGKMPTDRPIDGVDQTDVLFGKSAVGHRENLLTFIGPELVAVRVKQWRVYLTDMRPTGEGPQRLAGAFAANDAMAGYPKAYNIEMDPHEDLDVAGLFPWVYGPALEVILAYERSVKDHPNPPAANVTRFGRGAP